jgi:glucose/arabinose dehydrogenase
MLVTEREGRPAHHPQRCPRSEADCRRPRRVRACARRTARRCAASPVRAEPLIYLAYSKAGDNNLSTTALARGRFDGTALTDVKDIFVANTWSKSNTNYGGRIAFDRSGFLYLTIGERQEQQRAQDVKDHGGKVIRLRDEGSVPMDNPFVGRGRISAGDLLARSPQSAGAGDESGDWRVVGRTSMGRLAATSSTSCSQARTTAGRS